MKKVPALFCANTRHIISGFCYHAVFISEYAQTCNPTKPPAATIPPKIIAAVSITDFSFRLIISCYCSETLCYCETDQSSESCSCCCESYDHECHEHYRFLLSILLSCFIFGSLSACYAALMHFVDHS